MWYAIVLAGGSGSRMGAQRNKVLLELAGKPVIVRAVEAFTNLVDGVILVSREEDIPDMRAAMAAANLPVTIVAGGGSRQASVWNGLCALPEICTHVLIHDGARCLVDEGTIRRCMASVENHGTGVAAIPAIDTITQVDADEIVTATPDRSQLRAVQTPQGFTVELIRRAHMSAQQAGFLGTDDASLVERLGHPVRLTEGNRRNIKLTTPEDMIMAETFLGRNFPACGAGLRRAPPCRRTRPDSLRREHPPHAGPARPFRCRRGCPRPYGRDAGRHGPG